MKGTSEDSPLCAQGCHAAATEPFPKAAIRRAASLAALPMASFQVASPSRECGRLPKSGDSCAAGNGVDAPDDFCVLM